MKFKKILAAVAAAAMSVGIMATTAMAKAIAVFSLDNPACTKYNN